jgi:hypothetical protein
MKGLASKLRSPPSRMTPGRSPMRSPIPSSPPANFTGRGDGDLPTGGVSRSVYSQWVHADENHRTGETMRQDLMSEVQRGEDSAAQFLLLAADHVAEARASRVGAEAARRTVQRQNAAHVSDSRRKLAQIRDAKKKTKARIAAWGAQAKQADDALKERVQQSKDEIAMKKRMSALEVAAEHEQLKARLAKESATAAERARAQVEKVQRECGSQARADAAHFYYAFRKESAEEVRQGRGEREQERSTTKAKTLQRRKAVAEKQEALIAARGSLVGMKCVCPPPPLPHHTPPLLSHCASHRLPPPSRPSPSQPASTLSRPSAVPHLRLVCYAGCPGRRTRTRCARVCARCRCRTSGRS